MTNLSQWFDLEEQKPWEVGVYELSGDASWNCYAYWDGKSFSYAWTTEISDALDRAYGYRNDKSQVCWFYKMKKWRSLSTNPEVKNKQRNKRVTRHVVINRGGFIDKPVAVFSSKELAEEYASKLFAATAKTIRFRTPE